MMTLASADASRVATTDRQATANLILELAVDQAATLARHGDRDGAAAVMTRAGVKADRILGGA